MSKIRGISQDLSQSQLLEVVSSEHTLRGPSINDYAGSINLLGSAHTSQSLLDQFSVREIMSSCAETVGCQGVTSTQSLA